jgi:hypothetical protein
MYATHIVVVVMEVGAKCMYSNTYAFENQGKYIHEQTMNKPLIMNKIHYIC